MTISVFTSVVHGAHDHNLLLHEFVFVSKVHGLIPAARRDSCPRHMFLIARYPFLLLDRRAMAALTGVIILFFSRFFFVSNWPNRRAAAVLGSSTASLMTSKRESDSQGQSKVLLPL
jgi:hypothetical protein